MYHILKTPCFWNDDQMWKQKFILCDWRSLSGSGGGGEWREGSRPPQGRVWPFTLSFTPVVSLVWTVLSDGGELCSWWWWRWWRRSCSGFTCYSCSVSLWWVSILHRVSAAAWALAAHPHMKCQQRSEPLPRWFWFKRFNELSRSTDNTDRPQSELLTFQPLGWNIEFPW